MDYETDNNLNFEGKNYVALAKDTFSEDMITMGPKITNKFKENLCEYLSYEL